MDIISRPPHRVGRFNFDLPEFMHYLYLPVCMRGQGGVRLPPNVECVRPMIEAAIRWAWGQERFFAYAYLSARRGWATPGNSLNRPGWHCDGFGTDDLNFIWHVGAGTRFALRIFKDVPTDHVSSMQEIERQLGQHPACIQTYGERQLLAIDRSHVHAVPEIAHGHERQFIKISLSNDPYNLDGNSHNYLFDYAWPMVRREEIRNDPHRAQKDSA